jgi:hypothetical protein
MEHKGVVCVLLLSVGAFCQQHKSTTRVPDPTAEKRTVAVLDGMMTAQRTYLSVPVQDGKALRPLTEAVGTKSVVEIGTPQGTQVCGFASHCRTRTGISLRLKLIIRGRLRLVSTSKKLASPKWSPLWKAMLTKSESERTYRRGIH